MNTKQNVSRVVILRNGHRLSAITIKNKLVEGTIVSTDNTSIKVKKVATDLIESILPNNISAIVLDNFDYYFLKPFEPEFSPSMYVSIPTKIPPIVWQGVAEIIEISSIPSAPPAPTTAKPYIPPEPDNVSWIWDRYHNPEYVEGSNGQELKGDYISSPLNTYALKFSFTAQEEVEESTQTVNVKKYTYKPA
ncbi:hypothetical protein PGC34_26655 [Pseudomonas kribbensis]|uniref:hypothetical protein n=1 Tax=Pseudomonas TaxID=286 RepID=UPI00200F6C0E|nr:MULTISPECIES: hypothetical protein [unclassified Pseudomonas]MDL5597817.1 hypothetical protein [Bacillus subtilis]